MACSPSAITLTSLSTTTGQPSSARTKPGTSKPSHPGMIGGFVGRPVACSTGPGSPMPDTGHVVRRAADRGERAGGRARRPTPAPARGPSGDVEVDELAGQHRGREVGDRQAHVGRADVGGEHDAGRRVEGELRRRAATRRRRLAGRADQLGGQQGVDALGDRRSTEPGDGGQLAARPRHAVAQDLQQLAGAVHARK